MIYTVECSFAEPTREDEWNEFYSDRKLPALISVTGFHTSQRFKAISTGCPVYLALHTIDGPELLDGDEYREKGGGNFARWQPDITDWHRNLYDGLDRAPDVAAGEYLVLSSTGPEALTRLGLVPHRMHAVAMEKNPEQRWLATTATTDFPLLASLPKDVYVYAAMTPQLRTASSLAASEKR
ncbi:hypothetical protein M2284_003194 [Rhodococcus sp. LBL1]|nr:hypothetical protein [Rhodococcus sp. LBL1]MDH6684141.1 hypothetical protein [Rhodococcus sp. LBL2]